MIEWRFRDHSFLGFTSEIPDPDTDTMIAVPRDDRRTVFVAKKDV
jgi:hypothetical protein